MKTLVHIFAFGIACAFAYQSYDSLRSAFMGTQPNASAPNKDPQAIKTRSAGVLWGIMSIALSLSAFWYSIFR
jgi:hypothetical protein